MRVGIVCPATDVVVHRNGGRTLLILCCAHGRLRVIGSQVSAEESIGTLI